MSELDQLRQRVEAAEERLGSVLGQGRDYGEQLTEMVNSFEKDYRDQLSRISGYESRLAAVDQENVQLRQMLQHLLAAIEGGSRSGLSETLRSLSHRLGDLIVSHPGAVATSPVPPSDEALASHNPAETVQGQMQSVASLEDGADMGAPSESGNEGDDLESTHKSLIDDALDDSWIQDATYTEPVEELAADDLTGGDLPSSGLVCEPAAEPDGKPETVIETPEPQIVSGPEVEQEFATVDDTVEPSPSVLSADEELKVLESLSIMIGTDFDSMSEDAEDGASESGQPEAVLSSDTSDSDEVAPTAPPAPSIMIPEPDEPKPTPTADAGQGSGIQNVLAGASPEDGEEVPTAVRDIMERVSRMAKDLAEKQSPTG